MVAFTPDRLTSAGDPSADMVNVYLCEIGRTPLLTRERELTLRENYPSRASRSAAIFCESISSCVQPWRS